MRNPYIIVTLCLFCIFSCREKQAEKAQTAVLSFLLGDVQVNGKNAVLNQEIQSGTNILTGEKSRAEIKIGEASGIQIREHSHVQLSRRENKWHTEVKVGAVLNLMRPRNV